MSNKIARASHEAASEERTEAEGKNPCARRRVYSSFALCSLSAVAPVEEEEAEEDAFASSVIAGGVSSSTPNGCGFIANSCFASRNARLPYTTNVMHTEQEKEEKKKRTMSEESRGM